MQATDAPGLAAEQVSASRGERLVLRDVSFAVPAGGALIVGGANGAGKSTLLRVLAGLKRPDAGRVTWRGRDTQDDPAPAAYVGHLDAVKPALTAWENLGFAAWVGGDRNAALASMDLLALGDLPARFLSAGQRRRLALARLALAIGGLWLLDEPTVGLDAASVQRLGALLAMHRATGGVVVAATHTPLPLPDAPELIL